MKIDMDKVLAVACDQGRAEGRRVKAHRLHKELTK